MGQESCHGQSGNFKHRRVGTYRALAPYAHHPEKFQSAWLLLWSWPVVAGFLLVPGPDKGILCFVHVAFKFFKCSIGQADNRELAPSSTD